MPTALLLIDLPINTHLRAMTNMESMGYMDPPCSLCEETWDRGETNTRKHERHLMIDHGIKKVF